MTSQESLKVLTDTLPDAIRLAVQRATQAAVADINSSSTSASSTKTPTFSMPEYRSEENNSVADYFQRFEWALDLTKIPTDQFPNFARVHMGSELNAALKILISPRKPESLTFDQIKNILISHFDAKRNKYAESIKFRKIMQEPNEALANFALRLKKGTVHCDYAEFLYRMLIEQLLHGMNARGICDEIIKKKPEAFAAAYEIAHAMEVTHSTTT